MTLSVCYIISECLLIILCGVEGLYYLNHYSKLVSFLKLGLYMNLPMLLLLDLINYMHPMTAYIQEIANFCFGMAGLTVFTILGVWIVNQLIKAVYVEFRF